MAPSLRFLRGATRWLGLGGAIGPTFERLAVRVVVAGLLAGMALAIIGLATAGVAKSSSPVAERLFVSLVSGGLYVVVLAPLAVGLPAARWARLACIFVTLYVTGSVADLVEAYFFTSLLTPVSLVAALIFEAIPALVVALIVAVLLPAARRSTAGNPSDPTSTYALTTAAWRDRPLRAWAWRLLAAGLLYVPAYYGFAALVAPIEHPFYSDPTFVAQLQTRAPPDSVIVPLEAVRGVLFALALLPVVAVVPARRWSSLAYLTLIGVVVEAVVPLLGRSSWPTVMRLGNFAELTGDALIRAAAAIALLGVPPLVDRYSSCTARYSATTPCTEAGHRPRESTSGRTA